MRTITKAQARRFLLLKHGLVGAHRFIGKQGALDFIRQTGCIQFDPVDVCGKNAELTLQSRVKGFEKKTLYELLYKDRALVDYPDKNLSILPVEDWPYFARYRQAAREGGRRFEGLAQLEEEAKAYILKNGPVSAEDLPIKGKIDWHSSIHWSGNWGGQSNAARSVLEQMYSTGELIVHSKKGARKVYDLAQRHISEAILRAPDPIQSEQAHRTWRVLRRIGAVGLLWDRPSDAFLNIWGLKTPERNAAFEALQAQGEITALRVEGVNAPLYYRAQDEALLLTALEDTPLRPRCELLAPLDCMLWDRRLIRALFDFAYSWEIYTPADKRQYGFYVLPLLYGERFVGRVEAVADAKADALLVKHIFYEDGVRRTQRLEKAIMRCLTHLARFNKVKTVVVEENANFKDQISERVEKT